MPLRACARGGRGRPIQQRESGESRPRARACERGHASAACVRTFENVKLTIRFAFDHLDAVLACGTVAALKTPMGWGASHLEEGRHGAAR